VARRRQNPDEVLDPAVKLVKDNIEAAESAYHNNWASNVDQRWDDYHALFEEQQTEEDDEENWQSKIYPPYLIPIVEGMIASMVEPNLKLLAKPRPRPGEDVVSIERRVENAKVVEIAVNYAFEVDKTKTKQRPYMLQDMVTGLTVGKFYWEEREKDVYERSFYDDYEQNDQGEIEPVRASDVYSSKEKVKDDPTFKVLDVRDFFWPANCTAIEDAVWLADRVYMTEERLQELEDLGVYDKGTAKAVKDTSLPQQGKPGERKRFDEGGSGGAQRTKGLCEVIEMWWTDRVVTVVNRKVKARDGENKFWHGRQPYITCTAIPNFSQVNGKSIVETLAPVQAMLHFVQNQRLDNLKLLNNLIYVIRSDTEDAHSLKWYPGAQWILDDVNQVKELPVDPTPSTVSLQAEAMLKGDLQNLMGGLPYSGSTDTATVDQKTATGISIITNIAQRVIETRKYAYIDAFIQIGVAFLDLMQQFMLQTKTAALLGPGGELVWQQIDPATIQGAYDVYYDIQGDSLVRQERRAEAQSLYQTALQGAQMQAMFGTPLNLDAFMRKLLLSFDEPNPQTYFLTPQQQQAKMQGQRPQQLPPGQNGQVPGQGTAAGITPADQNMVPAGMGPLGSQGNAVTAAPGPGVSTSGPVQQMYSQTGPNQ
jgi:hypothetical protein